MEIKISKKPIDYKKAMLSLDKRVDEVYMNKNQELLWLLKHPNLYTGGISAPDNELIDKNKFPVFKTNRRQMDVSRRWSKSSLFCHELK